MGKINNSHIKIIIIIFIIVISSALFVRWQQYSSSWDKGILPVAEASYYGNILERLVKDWLQTENLAKANKEGLFEETYQIYLVIDLEKPAIWIEDNGHIRKNSFWDLPAEVDWKLYHFTPSGVKEMSRNTILKIRGRYTRQQTLEAFYLVGLGRDKGFISLQIDGQNCSMDYGLNKFVLPNINFGKPENHEYYGTLLVSEQEYQEYCDSLSDVIVSQSEIESDEPVRLSKLEENKAAWNRIEKHLYQKIEKHINSIGFKINKISVEPGQDFTAAHSKIRGDNNNIVRNIIGGASSIDIYLKIDYLENDIWYVKSALPPILPPRPQKTYNVEFLVSANVNITESQINELIEKGRQLQQPETIPESKWKIVLPNGVKIEFLAICDNPSAGKQWWGPDGTLIDFVPYINSQHYGMMYEDRKVYEFVWREIHSSNGYSSGFTVEGSNGAYYHSVYDRYGNDIKSDFQAEGFSFEKSEVKTTFKFNIKQNDIIKQTVLFKNISLVPDQNHGFEIEVIEAEEE